MSKHVNQITQEQYKIFPVGYIRRESRKTRIDILKPFIPALKELDQFSHVQVLWWFSEFEDDNSRTTTQFEKMPFDAPKLGVFACRSPMRPNPIGLTTAKILQIDLIKGSIEIAGMDAYDGTPVLDLKAYLPSCDRVQHPAVPDWASEWPQWLPENGLTLED